VIARLYAIPKTVSAGSSLCLRLKRNTNRDEWWQIANKTWLYQNCTKTLSYCDIGAYFEREADSPKLLKTLKTQSKGWSCWNGSSCLQSRCSPS
jgi:hypothetical protein